MKRTSKRTANTSPTIAEVCGDVSMDEIHFTVMAGENLPFPRVFKVPNRTLDVIEALTSIREFALSRGFEQVRVVVEPTGDYHLMPLAVAARMGCLTNLVNGEHVAKMRVVHFGDSGKTDKRDPEAIYRVVQNGRLIIDRRRTFPEVYHLLRDWGALYQTAEDGIIEAKGRVHRSLRVLFPDFDFGTDFLYGESGQAIMACFGLDPHEIVRQSPSRLYTRLRRSSHIRRSSVDRLLASARASVLSTPDGERRAFHRTRLAQAWEDWQLHRRRRDEAGAQLESLYDQARVLDPRLPAPVVGVISQCALARLLGELGPVSDFAHWRQVLRYAGLNLRERESGTFKGMIRIARKGRSQLRRILNQIALPLVKRGRLFGDFFHHKREVQKMTGPKAMTAVSRKIVKMLWGWIHSGEAFDTSRVFVCQSAHGRTAA